MWTCKHCKDDFEFNSLSEKANHSRWCSENPKKSDTQKLKIAQSLSIERKLGLVQEFQVSCKTCCKTFLVKEREKKFPSKEKYFCSRSCANSLGGKAKSEKYRIDEPTHYVAIAWKYHPKSCCVCGENKIVAVHHFDENHDNNDPKNLVPLCPTHHQYMHSRYRIEIQSKVEEYIKSRWAVSVVGGTWALQA